MSGPFQPCAPYLHLFSGRKRRGWSLSRSVFVRLIFGYTVASPGGKHLAFYSSDSVLIRAEARGQDSEDASISSDNARSLFSYGLPGPCLIAR